MLICVCAVTVLKKVWPVFLVPCYYLVMPRISSKSDETVFMYDSINRSAWDSPICPELLEAIHKSRSILQLERDWDGEGSPGFSEATLKRATDFLISSASRYWRDHRKRLIAPRILPGPDGNIDLHWKTPRRELLISIPTNPAESASYYGDDEDDGMENAIRGEKLDISTYNEWIIAWLMR